MPHPTFAPITTTRALRPSVMRIGCGVALALILSGCGGGGSGGTAGGTVVTPPAATPTPSPSPTPTGVLPSTASIKVAYIGASITAGAAGTGRVWSAQTSAWLRSRFRSVEVRDLSLPYTTSQFAAYRVDDDLMGDVPDLVFIEFAVNDLLLDANARARYTDALIYKLRRINPDVVIVYVAATSAADAAARLAGTVPAHVAQLRRLAERDQVRFIDAGAALWARVRATGGNILDYLPDGIHPNEAASDLYFAAVRDDLAGFLPSAVAGSPQTVHIAQSRLQGARILPATAASASGCVIGDTRASAGYWRFGSALACTAATAFTLDFSGTSIGFVYGAGTDTGTLDCSVDGSAAQTVTLFDGEPVGDRLFVYADLLTGLPNGSHRLSCRVGATPPTVNGRRSSGTRAVIAGFMVSEEQPVTL